MPEIRPILSVLLPTVVCRAVVFAKLLAEINRQTEGKPVEVLSACDNKEISVGNKRQALLVKSTGGYVVFIDDDDGIAPDYIDSILEALKTNPDCVGFEIDCTFNGGAVRKAAASKNFPWAENVFGYQIVRSAYHKTPVKREIALLAGFRDMRFGEDKDYSDRLRPHLKTEVFIKKVLYFYRFVKEGTSKERYGIK